MTEPFIDERAGNDGKGFYIRTFTGRKLYWDHVEDHDFDIMDIAHALAMKCRWSGHTKKFYSVAQHSVAVAWECPEPLRLSALLHDAAEAYMPDFPSPLKWFLRDKGFTILSEMEKRVDAAICKHFGLPYPRDPEIKRADLKLLSTESRDLMPPGEERVGMVEPMLLTINCWSPTYARNEFLASFDDFTGGSTWSFLS